MARTTRLTTTLLKSAMSHGRREDDAAKRRKVRNENSLAWTPFRGADPFALPERLADHIGDAFVPRSRTRALHLLVKLPASVPHSTEDEARAALMLTVEFAQHVYGGDAVFSARIDRDEHSTNTVDVFLAPKYIKKTKRTEKLAVSMTRFTKLLAKRHNIVIGENSARGSMQAQGQALQTELANWLKERGYFALRGNPKLAKGDDWVPPEVAAARAEADTLISNAEAKAKRLIDMAKQEILSRLRRAAQQRAEAERRRRKEIEDARKLAKIRKIRDLMRLDARRTELANLNNQLAQRREELAFLNNREELVAEKQLANLEKAAELDVLQRRLDDAQREFDGQTKQKGDEFQRQREELGRLWTLYAEKLRELEKDKQATLERIAAEDVRIIDLRNHAKRDQESAEQQLASAHEVEMRITDREAQIRNAEEAYQRKRREQEEETRANVKRLAELEVRQRELALIEAEITSLKLNAKADRKAAVDRLDRAAEAEVEIRERELRLRDAEEQLTRERASLSELLDRLKPLSLLYDKLKRAPQSVRDWFTDNEVDVTRSARKLHALAAAQFDPTAPRTFSKGPKNSQDDASIVARIWEDDSKSDGKGR